MLKILIHKGSQLKVKIKAKKPMVSSETMFELTEIDRACRKTRCNSLNNIAKNAKNVTTFTYQAAQEKARKAGH